MLIMIELYSISRFRMTVRQADPLFEDVHLFFLVIIYEINVSLRTENPVPDWASVLNDILAPGVR